MGIWQTILQGDALTQGVALLLLMMSVVSWVVVLWKAWLLVGVESRVQSAFERFWSAPDIKSGEQVLRGGRADDLVAPLVRAVTTLDHTVGGTLASSGDRADRLTRVLRDALHRVLRRLQYGQVLLATVGATAPFVGLLGTVWGIYHALVDIGSDGRFRIEQVSGPVGEALVMTAAGLAVAIPAVLAYNVFGRLIVRLEADLEGFAFDLRALVAPGARAGETV